jgi:hypothetical protein
MYTPEMLADSLEQIRAHTRDAGARHGKKREEINRDE